jgi:alanyl-tRNA synthetase
VVSAEVGVPDPKLLLEVVDRVNGQLAGDGVVMLASGAAGRASIVVSVAPSLLERGLDARNIVTAAASVIGGGGGGRETLAQAGGRDPSKLGEALHAARDAVAGALS